MRIENAVFLLVLVCAVGFFSYNVQRLLSYLSIAGPDDRGGEPLVRLKNVISDRRSCRRRSCAIPSPARCTRSIFWGFCVLTAGTIEMLLHGMLPRVLVRVSAERVVRASTRYRRTSSACSCSPRSPSRSTGDSCCIRLASRATSCEHGDALSHPRRHRRIDGDDVRGERARARARSRVDRRARSRCRSRSRCLCSRCPLACSRARTRCSGGRTRCSCSPS